MLIRRILPYSAIKSMAKTPPPYSILKPETSSDSPSAKSKGARFVSAKADTNHSTIKIGPPRHPGNPALKDLILLKLNALLMIITHSRTRAMLIS